MADKLDEAQRLYSESMDAMHEQRTQIEEDLRFSEPSNPDQWEYEVRIQRENDPGGRRPCLVHDQTGQFVANVSGQIEKQPPSLHAIPVSGGAIKEAAEQIDGRFRHIEHASRAAQHYARALTSAARTGVGYLIVRPEYVDRALGWQEPRISSEPDPLKVVFDPWSTETDGSDATFGFIMTDMSIAAFEKRWKGKKVRSFGDTGEAKSDSRKSVLIAEQWYQETQKRNMIVYLDADGREASALEDDYHAANQAAGRQLPYINNYTDKQQVIHWRRMSGEDVLEESVYPADWIGILPIYGYVGFSEGRMRYCGIPRRARVPQQAYNYHISELQVPRAFVLMPERALGGGNKQRIWDRAMVERRAFMPYTDFDENGEVRQPTLIDLSGGISHEAGAAQALRDIQASIGMYQANLGAPSNETSGVAIENRKQQGEASTAHFPSHMAASLGHLGNIVMQMDARLADTRRQQPIMGIDGTSGAIMVDPAQQKAFQRGPEGVSINPNVGKYAVRVVVGASYSTQRSQTNAAFGEIMRGNKELAQVVAPFWAQTLDFPGSDKFAQAMAAMAPAPVKAILQPEGKDAPDPAKLAQDLAQCQRALQEAIQHAKEAQDDADQAIAAVADAKRLAEVRERELDIDAYKAETDRLKVTGANEEQIQLITRDLINQMLMQPDPLPGDPEPDEQAWQAGQPMAEQPEFQAPQEPIEPEQEPING